MAYPPKWWDGKPCTAQRSHVRCGVALFYAHALRVADALTNEEEP
jgi:hypothetical protein